MDTSLSKQKSYLTTVISICFREPSLFGDMHSKVRSVFVGSRCTLVHFVTYLVVTMY